MSNPFKPPFATVTDNDGRHIVGGRLSASLMIPDGVWEKIRDQFSEGEKVQLRLAVEGQVICPKGILIDPDAVGDEALAAKIRTAVKQA